MGENFGEKDASRVTLKSSVKKLSSGEGNKGFAFPVDGD